MGIVELNAEEWKWEKLLTDITTFWIVYCILCIEWGWNEMRILLGGRGREWKKEKITTISIIEIAKWLKSFIFLDAKHSLTERGRCGVGGGVRE